MNNWLLLHGALGSKEQMKPLLKIFTGAKKVFAIDILGHGEKGANVDFSFQAFAEDIVLFLEKEGIQEISIFGHSMGGYLALYLARHYPERVIRVITYGTKFEWNPKVSQIQIDAIEPEILIKKSPAFVEILKKRHSANNWETVVKKSRQLLKAIGENQPLSDVDFSMIGQPTDILLGSLDRLVTKYESIKVAQLLHRGKVSVLQCMGHSLHSININQLAPYFNDYL